MQAYRSASQQGGSSSRTPMGRNMESYGMSAPPTSSSYAGPQRVESTRKISSTIVGEEFIGPPPQDYPVREVEVQGQVQEIVKHVPRKEIIEMEKRVPKVEIEYVDRVVEVPRVVYRDSVREVPVYKDVFVDKPVPQIVNVPKEVIQERRVPRVNYVEEVRQVPGEIIEVPKPYTVEQKVEITRYTDHKRPVVVAQTVKPVIVEGHGVTEVDVYEYEPEVVPVDVHVMKGVKAQVQNNGVVSSEHRVVSVPAAQYNTILQKLNQHLAQTELSKLPYLSDNGQVTFLGQTVAYSEPQPGAPIQGLDMSKMSSTYVDYSSRRVVGSPSDVLVNQSGTYHMQAFQPPMISAAGQAPAKSSPQSTSYQTTSYQPASYQTTSYQPTSHQPTSYLQTSYQPTTLYHQTSYGPTTSNYHETTTYQQGPAYESETRRVSHSVPSGSVRAG